MIKKIMVAIMLCMPISMIAQSNWEIPKSARQKQEEAKIAEKKAQKAEKAEKQSEKAVQKEDLKDDPKYLAGAVPVVDGKVTFTLDVDAKGKSAQEIYDITYQYLDQLTLGEEQFPESHIALINKDEHQIAATMKEWLEFSRSALTLDRTIFRYTLIVNCTDGHLNMTMSRIVYDYDKERKTGYTVTAEEWITDEYGLNKKQTALAKFSGKFRRKTIDRKDQIFTELTNLLTARNK